MSDDTQSQGAGHGAPADVAEPARPPTREVVAVAILVIVGALGLATPIAAIAFFRTLLAAHTGIGDLVIAIGAALAATPMISVVSLAAAVGSYRQARWGRPLALGASTLLIAGLPIWLLVTTAVPPGEVPGLVTLALWHGLLVAPHQVVGVGTAAGVAVAWGLASHGRPAPPRRPTSRPSVAMALLIVVGIASLVPHLRSLATVIAGPVSANGGISGLPPGSSGITGVLVGIPSLVASATALAGARAIRSRAPHGPYLAAAASAIAGPWSAAWMFMIGLSVDTASESGPAAPIRAIAVPMLLAVAVLSVLAPFIVTGSVIRKRDWFLDPATQADPDERSRRGRPGRFWTAAAGLAVVSFVPLVIASAASIANPPPPQLYYRDVLFDGSVYRHIAPVHVPESELEPAGTLAAWTEDLAIDPGRPDAFTLPGVATDLAIVVRGGLNGAGQPFSLFIPSGGAEQVPLGLCQYVPLEAPNVFVEPCVPSSILLGGSRYDIVAGGYVVTVGDLEALGSIVEVAEAADERVDLEAMGIHGVPAADAIALLIGQRVLVYESSGRFVGGELCRYSPTAIEDPLIEDKFLDGGVEPVAVPYGCLFPRAVLLDGRPYIRDGMYRDLFAIANDALAPIGTASALHPDFEASEPGAGMPFPPTVDATAYRIAGVDPALAIAFLVGDEVVVVTAPADDGATVVPAALCPFVDPHRAAELAAQYGGEKEGLFRCPDL